MDSAIAVLATGKPIRGGGRQGGEEQASKGGDLAAASIARSYPHASPGQSDMGLLDSPPVMSQGAPLQAVGLSSVKGRNVPFSQGASVGWLPPVGCSW